MSAEMSYKNYRSNLKSISPPCIPYIGNVGAYRAFTDCLGVFLSDLTFIGDGNPDQIGKLINFTKVGLSYMYIINIDMIVYQKSRYVSMACDSIYIDRVYFFVKSFLCFLIKNHFLESYGNECHSWSSAVSANCI